MHLPSPSPHRSASRSSFTRRLILPALGLVIASACSAAELDRSDSEAPARMAAARDDVSSGEEGSSLLPSRNVPGEKRLTAWRTLTQIDDDLQRWADRQIKAMAEPSADDAAEPAAGNTGRRPGDLDPNLQIHTGEPGVFRIPVDAGFTWDDRAVGVSQRADGKVYVVGQTGELGPDTRIGIIRLTGSRGILDQSFGTNGQQVISIANPDLTLVKAIGVTQGNFERFYILAKDRELANNHTFALICLRTFLGSNDPFTACPGFGNSQGMLVLYYDFAGAPGCGTSHDEPNDLFFAPDHADLANSKFYLAGAAQRHYNACSDVDMAVLRVDMNGALDTSFNGNGMRMLGVSPVVGSGNWWASAFAVAERADGRVVLGGTSGTDSDRRAVVAQFLNDGTFDTDFCPPGESTCDSPSTHRSGLRAWSGDTSASVVRAFAPTLGNGLYVARWVEVNNSVIGRLARIERSGGCSQHCNQVNLFPSPETRTVPIAMLYQPTVAPDINGQIVVTAYHYPNGAENESRVLVYRFNADLADNAIVHDFGFTTGPAPYRNDITFPAGSSSTPRNARPAVITQDRQGRFLIAGYAKYSDDDLDYGFARLQNDVIFTNGVND